MQEQSTLVIVVDGFRARWPIAQLQIPANRTAEHHMCGSEVCAIVARYSTPDAAEVSLQDHAVLLARCWHSLGWQAKPAAVQKHPEFATLVCFQHELFHTDCGSHSLLSHCSSHMGCHHDSTWHALFWEASAKRHLIYEQSISDTCAVVCSMRDSTCRDVLKIAVALLLSTARTPSSRCTASSADVELHSVVDSLHSSISESLLYMRGNGPTEGSSGTQTPSSALAIRIGACDVEHAHVQSSCCTHGSQAGLSVRIETACMPTLSRAFVGHPSRTTLA